MKGTPTYTQHSVAWPQLNLTPVWHKDEVLLTFEANGGGAHGEAKFTFMEFSDKHMRVEFSCFIDSVSVVTDERVTSILAWIGRMSRKRRERLTPIKLITKMEALGWEPSIYHKNGAKA